MGFSLTPEEMLEVFGDHDPAEHAAEAEERWGDTDAYRESQRRVASYTKQDWLRLREEVSQIESELAAALRSGQPATSEAAMDAAERHRLHIDRSFYPCAHEMHRALGQMYVDDARFAKHYEDIADGLSVYVRDAIAANADRNT